MALRRYACDPIPRHDRARREAEARRHFDKHAAGTQPGRSIGLERGQDRTDRTYLWALQSRSIRMSSSEDSAAAGAEHIPRPRATAAAAAATRRASAAAMPARTTSVRLSGSAQLSPSSHARWVPCRSSRAD